MKKKKKPEELLEIDNKDVKDEEKLEKQDLNDPNQIIHYGEVCDSCKENPILGIRYKCLECFEYDLCEKCI